MSAILHGLALRKRPWEWKRSRAPPLIPRLQQKPRSFFASEEANPEAVPRQPPSASGVSGCCSVGNGVSNGFPAARCPSPLPRSITSGPRIAGKAGLPRTLGPSAFVPSFFHADFTPRSRSLAAAPSRLDRRQI
jgi:hypothetical protein